MLALLTYSPDLVGGRHIRTHLLSSCYELALRVNSGLVPLQSHVEIEDYLLLFHHRGQSPVLLGLIHNWLMYCLTSYISEVHVNPILSERAQ